MAATTTLSPPRYTSIDEALSEDPDLLPATGRGVLVTTLHNSFIQSNSKLVCDVINKQTNK
jgi:hypothetical protein